MWKIWVSLESGINEPIWKNEHSQDNNRNSNQINHVLLCYKEWWCHKRKRKSFWWQMTRPHIDSGVRTRWGWSAGLKSWRKRQSEKREDSKLLGIMNKSSYGASTGRWLPEILLKFVPTGDPFSSRQSEPKPNLWAKSPWWWALTF